jgi:8-oxo-dGTP pyrophosphatase MutT (NUDIX family)
MAEPPSTALAASMALIREVFGRAGGSPQEQLARASAGLKLVDATLTTIGSGAESGREPTKLRAGRAAVAIIVREAADEQPEILLIRRAERPNDPWSGHMAFPGGREELHDPNLLATALRETREEIALDLERTGRLLGQLQALPAVARGQFIGMEIVPFVFELTDQAPLAFNPAEVAEAIWIPLEPLRRGALRTTVPYELGGQRLNLPAHDFEGRIVWGLTYRMLDQLFALLG